MANPVNHGARLSPVLRLNSRSGAVALVRFRCGFSWEEIK